MRRGSLALAGIIFPVSKDNDFRNNLDFQICMNKNKTLFRDIVLIVILVLYFKLEQ